MAILGLLRCHCDSLAGYYHGLALGDPETATGAEKEVADPGKAISGLAVEWIFPRLDVARCLGGTRLALARQRTVIVAFVCMDRGLVVASRSERLALLQRWPPPHRQYLNEFPNRSINNFSMKIVGCNGRN
jgi:hypothetical protein